MDTFWAVSNILLWIVVVVQTVVIVMLAKLVGQFIQRFRLSAGGTLETGLKYGERAPMFRAKDQHGELVLLRESQGKRTLVFIGKQTCDTCHELTPHLGALKQKFDLRLIVLTGEEQEGHPLMIPDGVSLIRSEEIKDMFQPAKLPTATCIDPDGYVLFSETVTNLLQLNHLLDQSTKKAS